MKTKAEPKIRYIRTGMAWDWLISAVLISAGLAGFHLSSHPQILMQISDIQADSPSTVHLVPELGSVRFRRHGSITWQDIIAPQNAGEGDRVSTGRDSIAYLVFDGGARAKILGDTVVVVHRESPKNEKPSDLLSMLNSTLRTPPPQDSYFEIKKGRVAISPGTGSKPLKIVAKNEALNLQSKTSSSAVSASLIVDVGRGDPSAPIRISSDRPENFKLDWVSKSSHPATAQIEPQSPLPIVQKVPEISLIKLGAPSVVPLPPLVAPEITAPESGARFYVSRSASSADIQLKWKPLPPEQVAELEFKERGSNKTVSTRKIDGVPGITLRLSPNDYSWKVRSLTGPSGEQSPSAWSDERQLSVSEIPPVPEAPAKPSAVTDQNASPPHIDREASAPKSAERALEAQKKVDEEKIKSLQAAEKSAALERASNREKTEEAAQKKKYAEIVRAEKEVIERIKSSGRQIVLFTSEGMSSPEGQAAGARIRAGAPDLNEENYDYAHLKVPLAWRQVYGAQGYHVEIIRNGTVLHEAQAQHASYEFRLDQNEIKDGLNFEYRITATLPSGETVSSGILPMTLELAPPVQRTPASGQVFQPTEPVLLTWTSMSWVNEYNIEVARDPDFSQVFFKSKTENNFIAVPAKGLSGSYYWRVRGEMSDHISPWTPVSSFKVH